MFLVLVSDQCHKITEKRRKSTYQLTNVSPDIRNRSYKCRVDNLEQSLFHCSLFEIDFVNRNLESKRRKSHDLRSMVKFQQKLNMPSSAYDNYLKPLTILFDYLDFNH